MANQSKPKISLVKEDLSEEQLNYYLGRKLIAVDCEMMGLNVHRDRLCLVQIGDDEKNIVLIQIALGQKKAPRLKKLLESKDVCKIFHYARTDIAWLKHWLDINIKSIFCTKIASKIARTYTDKHSLKELCKEVINKDLNKTQQSSYWGSEELDKKQQEYAANDVAFLVSVYEALIHILSREEKLELAEKCSAFTSTMAELDILGYEAVLEH
jgi:ribonuclease D